MTMDNTLTDTALLQQIGERLAQLRLAKNLTQEQLAEQARLGLRTLQRLELGQAATQLSGFVRVCRSLGLAERFDLLLPAQPGSPIAQLKLQRRQRKRASGRKGSTKPAAPWTWGETP